jgi:hypothetical protein
VNVEQNLDDIERLSGLRPEDRARLKELVRMAADLNQPIEIVLLQQNRLGLDLVTLLAKYRALHSELESKRQVLDAKLVEEIENSGEDSAMRRRSPAAWLTHKLTLRELHDPELHAFRTAHRQVGDAVRFLEDLYEYVTRTRGPIVVQLSVNERESGAE